MPRQAKLGGWYYDEDIDYVVWNCLCGAEFKNYEFMITAFNDKEHPAVCPKCGRKFYMVVTEKIYELEVINEPNQIPQNSGD